MKFMSAMFLIGVVVLLTMAGYGETLDESDAAVTIDAIVNKNKNVQNQYAVLYLHDNEGKVEIDNAAVKSELGSKKELPHDIRSSPWPSNSVDTNLLLSAPDKYGTPNRRHAESKLFPHLLDMITGYKSRHNSLCPNYILLGSVYTPCLGKNDKSSGCAPEYLAAKKDAEIGCPNTKFYLYIRSPEKTYDKVLLNETLDLIRDKDIEILTPKN